MKLACRVFGHRGLGSGWWGDGLYGRAVPAGIDGLNTAHFAVTQECERCGERRTIARFHHHAVLDHVAKHLPTETAEALARAHPPRIDPDNGRPLR